MLVEQNVVQTLALATRAVVVEHGRVVLEDATADMAGDERSRAGYLGI